MRDSKKTLRRGGMVLTFVAIALSLALSAQAQTETTLYSFSNGPDGYNPVASLIFDGSGNLLSTTSEGGNFTACSTGCGVVFELSPSGGGGWTESVAHTFNGGSDGKNPFAGLISDGAGNFYGATGLGVNTIFKLSPNSGGGWTKTVIHYFVDPKGGTGPYANLIFDSAGNLYGTAHNGGSASCNCGVVFELSPTGSGWKETVLHTFTAENGAYPSGNLIFDSAGNLYGTTSKGGTGCTFANCGLGVVFELTPVSGGGWKEIPLFEFMNKNQGEYPNAGLIFDSSGNLYGTTQYGGNLTDCAGGDGCGVVFELSPRVTGAWKETEIHLFSSSDGAYPLAGFVADSAGNLYSTAYKGGTSDCGVVFKLTPGSGGTWTESTVYNFTCQTNDGGLPESNLILDAAGNLYGTTQAGGANGLGTVFELTP